MTTSAYGVRRSISVPQPAPVEREIVEVVAVRRLSSPLAATALSILAALMLGFVAYVAVVGNVVHARAQQLAYASLRNELANGTAPLGQVDDRGRAVALGAPVALLEAPGIREVVREGTTSGVLTGGPGHRRDSVLPGQPGVSVIYGRKAAFGAPFAGIATLRRGALFHVTTGQGRHEYRVLGVRRSGDPAPIGGGPRLTLVTATGPAYLPSGVLLVDTALVSAPVPAAPLRPIAMTGSEGPLAGDRTALVAMVLWGQGLVLAACLVVWMGVRWGRRQAWLVGVPLLGALGLVVASSAARLLPNLT